MPIAGNNTIEVSIVETKELKAEKILGGDSIELNTNSEKENPNAEIVIKRGEKIPYIIQYNAEKECLMAGPEGSLKPFITEAEIEKIIQNTTPSESGSTVPAEHNHNELYYTKNEIDEKIQKIGLELGNKANTTSVYTKKEVDNKIKDVSDDIVKSNVSYSKEDIDLKLQEINSIIEELTTAKGNLETLIENKADKDHTHAEYLTEHQDITGKADLTGAEYTGEVKAPTVTITDTLNIPGGKIWIE